MKCRNLFNEEIINAAETKLTDKAMRHIYRQVEKAVVRERKTM